MTERRILARVENAEFEAPELDWIDSRVRILGEHFAMAKRSVQSLIDTGAMIVTRTEVFEMVRRRKRRIPNAKIH